MQFNPWPKTPRLQTLEWEITEKMNGTNSQILVGADGTVRATSRNRLITPENDNFGFAALVKEHQEMLSKLEPGAYIGEWCGPGIQKNPHGLESRTFFLFEGNKESWEEITRLRPPFCMVPVFYSQSYRHRGPFNVDKLCAAIKDAQYLCEGDQLYNYHEGFVLRLGNQRFKWIVPGAK